MAIKINNLKQNSTIWSEKIRMPQKANALQSQEAISEDKDKRLDKNVVASLVRRSNRILVSIRSHRFPFDFFPDTINIEEGRINIITRYFFYSSEVHSVDVTDIANIFIVSSLFFAELVIVSKTFTENEIRIKNLRKKEAIYVRRIIEGLRVFADKQIDTSVYTKGELISKLEEISTTEIVI